MFKQHVWSLSTRYPRLLCWTNQKYPRPAAASEAPLSLHAQRWRNALPRSLMENRGSAVSWWFMLVNLSFPASIPLPSFFPFFFFPTIPRSLVVSNNIRSQKASVGSKKQIHSQFPYGGKRPGWAILENVSKRPINHNFIPVWNVGFDSTPNLLRQKFICLGVQSVYGEGEQDHPSDFYVCETSCPFEFKG